MSIIPHASHGQPEPVKINNRHLRDISDDLYAAVIAHNHPPEIFVRGGLLTRVRTDETGRPIIDTLDQAQLRHRIARVTDTHRTNKTDGHTAHVPPPLEAVRDILAAGAWPELPPLEAVVEAPVIRPDGTILQTPGYDRATRLVYTPAAALQVPDVPDRPTGRDLISATGLLDELVCDFPFDTTADRANALGALLTMVARPAIAGDIPLGLLDAPEPGTGKSLLVSAFAIVVTGTAAAMKPLPDTDDELRKTITATLVEGATVVIFDNVESAIRAPSLAQVLTSDTWSDRILGRSEIVKLPNRATWFATGNNITVGGDLARRCYRIRLDAHQARPYTRTGFRHDDLPGWAQANRGDLLWALLTLARAWWAAGQPAAPDVPVMGGFTPWAQTIAGVLHHAGIEGFLANLHDFVDEADTDAAAWETFLAAWWHEFGDRPVVVRQLVDEIGRTASPLADACPDELADKIDRTGFSKSLGRALKRKAGRRYGDPGWQIGVTERKRGGRRWFVTPDQPPDDEPELPLDRPPDPREEEERF